MATQMQLRGGTTAENLLFTGAPREVTVDTDKNSLVVHDGITPGGYPAATEQQVADGTYFYVDDTAGGSTANAYILVPQPNTNEPNSYLNGVVLGFVTANANTGPATANFQGLGVKSIKYLGGSDPAPGDVFGRVTLIYDAAGDWLELQRKPSESQPQIRTIGASVTGNAMTVTLAPTTIDFRSSILNSDSVSRRVTTSQMSITIPAGATLGTVSGVQSRIVLLAIDNAGAVELAVANYLGSGSLDEMGVINTSPLTAASVSGSTFYSANSRSGVPYRVMGVVQSTQASAGVWTSTPSLIQGQGGQATIKQNVRMGVPQTTASGTSIDFTNIPPSVNRITLLLSGVSTSGSSNYQVQIGSGVIETSGYTCAYTSGEAATSTAAATTGHIAVGLPAANSLCTGQVVISRFGATSWVITSICTATVALRYCLSTTSKTISGEIDRIRITTVNGTDTFDSGSVNVTYEV